MKSTSSARPVLAKFYSGESGRPNEAVEMTRPVDLAERLSVLAKAQDRVLPTRLPEPAGIPLPGEGKFVAPATVMFAAWGLPSISSIRTESIRIMRPIVIRHS